ncbi:unnamed protein product [Pleuronectes platessa]|uniref:Uncharacterized protein n=1 Tax=Pleuronectes platessa TaxID=8262 RepID=A0A9N7VRY5_PLEPL|nr:unnamed protein product [Pleuronectes platessa]
MLYPSGDRWPSCWCSSSKPSPGQIHTGIWTCITGWGLAPASEDNADRTGDGRLGPRPTDTLRPNVLSRHISPTKCPCISGQRRCSRPRQPNAGHQVTPLGKVSA